MSPTRIRALVAAVVAVLAAAGIALPNLGSDDSTSTSTATSTAAQTTSAPQASTVSTTSSQPTASTSTSTGSASPTASTAGPDPGSEEGVAISRVVGEIDSGQSSQYSQDGTTFENREGHLPSEDYGYYREYTVLTPNSPDRGARRLILGEHGELYYTSDHYSSFTRIDPDRYR